LPDNEPPVITSFILPETHNSLIVPVLSFEAEDDDDEVIGYLITESDSAPDAHDENWSPDPWDSIILDSEGSMTMFAWAKDWSDNVSESALSEVTAMLPVTVI